MRLSRRLLEVASLVTDNHVVADVGTDHGYVPIFLIQEKRIPRAIAMDINPGPIQRAREHIEAAGLAELIDIRLSDGAQKLCVGEADTLILAGMGGQLMIEIMSRGEHILRTMKEYILQPQSEWSEFRHYLCENGYCVKDEKMLCEDGKYYLIIRAVQGREEYADEIQYRYGKRLLNSGDKILKEYLEKERSVLGDIIDNLGRQTQPGSHISARVMELEEEFQWNKLALEYFS